MEGNQSTELLQNTRVTLLSMSHLAGEEGAGESVEAGDMGGEAKNIPQGRKEGH